ncbi:hypothetical protein CK203_088759 [Vitis vinifera]|uniref:Retrovirus-related Pol polyprotein from transposon TNT 1-94-like beta-barrel domain-containing protein n=1 Tax=Vitis vinifera TaxID=29760 RepID=A0A438CLM7_VITVI|nr:hypothetical protein CK203_088759 [Vitis vinifera]
MKGDPTGCYAYSAYSVYSVWRMTYPLEERWLCILAHYHGFVTLKGFESLEDKGGNNNTTPVIGEGSLTLTDTLNLDSVLVVPSLDYNLLSVSQITAALSCIVIFWPEFCVIKDIQTRQTIGCGIKRGKLYYLDLQSKDSNKLQQALMADGSEGRRKSLKFGCGIDVWDMLPLVI